MAMDHSSIANLIWQIADLLRGPYRPPQYERVMLPMTVLRRFDCVLAATKGKVVAEHEKAKGGKLTGDALDTKLNRVAGQRFHNHSPLDFAKLKGDPDHIHKHLVSYIKGFSANVQRIFDYFEIETEIEKEVSHNGGGDNVRFGDIFIAAAVTGQLDMGGIDVAGGGAHAH
ncbi:MAG: type I restriction-modification system subunit M N-terminal domain-containing protein, partial [Polyangiaceae bacterium]